MLLRTDHSEEFANKDGDGEGQSRVSKFMFFKIKAHTEDALQRMFWSKLNSGHGFTGLKAAFSQVIIR